MAGKGSKNRSQAPVIIKRSESVEAGHHGGAWKVAYADFVTAMMAFFLLMWLLNATTEDQRKGLADYFSPSNLMSHATSGSGQPFGGHTAFDQGALVSDRGKVDVTYGKHPVIDQTEDGDDPVHDEYHRARHGDGVGIGPVTDDQYADDEPDPSAKGQKGNRNVDGPGGPNVAQRVGPQDVKTQPAVDKGAPDAKQAGAVNPPTPDFQKTDAPRTDAPRNDAPRTDAQAAALDQAAAEKAAAAMIAAQERAAFEKAAEEIRKAVQSDPALADLGKQLAIDMTPQGLRIQIMDELKLPMFATGSASPNERTRLLIQKVIPILNKLKEPISIAGYTDAAPFPGPDRTNWELSADRANATRRLLVDGGFAEARIQSVAGHAERDPLLPADPFAAANRRIAIMVLRQAPREAPVPDAAPGKR